MNNVAGQAKPHTAMLFSNSDSRCLHKIPARCHGAEAAAVGTCFTLNTGGTCSKRLNLSFNKHLAGVCPAVFIAGLPGLHYVSSRGDSESEFLYAIGQHSCPIHIPRRAPGAGLWC